MKKNKEKRYGPVLVLILLIAFVAGLSFVLPLLGVEGYKTVANNGTLETSLLTIKNIISLDGLKFIIGNAVHNFSALEPLVLIIYRIHQAPDQRRSS